MVELFNFLAELVKNYPIHVELYYSKIMDWTIRIYKKGCADKGEDVEIVNEQDCDLSYLAAKAYVRLKDWLLENEGGY